MKRLLLILLVALVTAAPSCKDDNPFIITLYAQSLPITKTFTWDANAASDAVIHYTVKFDGIVVGNPTGLTQQITINTAGKHQVAVSATNAWGTSTDTPFDINVVIPAAPRNLRVQ